MNAPPAKQTARPSKQAQAAAKEDKSEAQLKPSRAARSSKAAKSREETKETVKQESKPVPEAKKQRSGPLPNVTALVVPPYSLSTTLMERIRENYTVVEAERLNVSEVEGLLGKKGQ